MTTTFKFATAAAFAALVLGVAAEAVQAAPAVPGYGVQNEELAHSNPRPQPWPTPTFPDDKRWPPIKTPPTAPV